MPNRPLRVLSIGAHPADIFDQSGGTMAHHVARGDYVASVVLTHGDITDVAEKKLAAMDCLVSQGYGGAYARKRIERVRFALGAGRALSLSKGARTPLRQALRQAQDTAQRAWLPPN